VSEPAAFGPFSFCLTDSEARVAASRVALRLGLMRRFGRDYVAPLVAFVLLLLFVAILAFGGLIGRRLAEAALLIGAIAFLATRFSAHWRLRRVQRRSEAAIKRIVARGEVQIELGEGGLTLHYAQADLERRSFADIADAENAGGLIYFWPQDGAPTIIPTRVLVSEQEAARFLAFARAKISNH
jgi:hypothetical protein